MKHIKISHLVVNGCSYTYGHGISDPIKDGWASIIAKRLGVPLINLAVPGQGNQAIFRRTNRYFYKDLFNDNNPFYIHAYSQASRREAYISSENRYVIVGGEGNMAQVEKEIIRESDDFYYCLAEQEKLHIWASINHLLDTHDVPHLMADYMPCCNGKTEQWIEDNETILKNELYLHNGKLENFNMVTHDFEKTICQHETVAGHKHLADYIWKEFNKRYTYEVVEKDCATLHDILIIPPYNQEALDTSHNNPIDYYPREFCRNIYYFHELGLDYLTKNWDGKPDNEEAMRP